MNISEFASPTQELTNFPVSAGHLSRSALLSPNRSYLIRAEEMRTKRPIVHEPELVKYRVMQFRRQKISVEVLCISTKETELFTLLINRII